MIGRTLAHYRITAAIGAGGMGEVYRATDTKLGRDVALKVLPAEMASNRERLERFRREARALAALNHPHIVTIHSVEEAEGVHFLTMELVEGQPLDRVIAEGALPVGRILEIAAALTDALAAAHEKGVVHRDLKPANVMLTTEGRVKVLDFGLAKVKGSEDAASAESALPTAAHTREGIVMGTMPYMSPEQVSGLEVDHRTDIFSLGVILYEMATGRRPFEGRSAAGLASAILRDTPRPLFELRKDLPQGLERLIQRCLEKAARDRIQTASQVSAELRAAPPAGAGSAVSPLPPVTLRKQRKVALAIAFVVLVLGSVALGVYLRRRATTVALDSIVVLPFENRTSDPEADYISDGITESISNSLTGLGGDLKVIPTSVAFHYKGKGMTTQAVGDELRVAAVLTGRVSLRGDSLTIGVELDDVRQRKQLWGTQYNRKLSDLLAVQRDIASEVSKRLRSQLSGEDQQKLTRGSTDNPVAYQLYLKGIYHASKYTKDGFRKGIEYFNQALAEDPDYALAHGGLAFTYMAAEDWFFPPHEAAPKAKEAAKRALAIDETISGPHMSLAIVSHWYDWDWGTAEREFVRAIELSPDDPRPRDFYAWLLANLGRHDEAIAQARQAQQLDPVSPETNLFLGSVLVFAHRYEEAVRQLLATVDLDPSFWYAYDFLGRAYEQQGRMKEAVAAYQKAIEIEKDNAENWSHLGHAFAVSGQRAEALKMIAHLEETAAHSYVAPYNVSLVYAGLGDAEQALAWLERAYAERSSLLVLYMSNDARWDRLRADPRFGDLVRRIGLPEAKR